MVIEIIVYGCGKGSRGYVNGYDNEGKNVIPACIGDGGDACGGGGDDGNGDHGYGGDGSDDDGVGEKNGNYSFLLNLYIEVIHIISARANEKNKLWTG